MNLNLLTIEDSAIVVFEISFLNKLFSSFLNWDSRSFTIVKVKFEDGEERLAIDKPTDITDGEVLIAVGRVEGLLRSMTLEEIIKTYID